MAVRTRRHTNPREVVRVHRKSRIRKGLSKMRGVRPRLCVFRSNKFIYAQVIDDLQGKTLAQANSAEKDFKSSSRRNLEAAKMVGQLIAERAKSANVTKIVFDRNGYDYHGRIQAIAEGAREAGLEF